VTSPGNKVLPKHWPLFLAVFCLLGILPAYADNPQQTTPAPSSDYVCVNRKPISPSGHSGVLRCQSSLFKLVDSASYGTADPFIQRSIDPKRASQINFYCSGFSEKASVFTNGAPGKIPQGLFSLEQSRACWNEKRKFKK
jgi:hypothetical protein